MRKIIDCVNICAATLSESATRKFLKENIKNGMKLRMMNRNTNRLFQHLCSASFPVPSPTLPSQKKLVIVEFFLKKIIMMKN
jgi:hypothetical protein